MLRFVVVRGTLAWSIGTTLISTAIQVFQHHQVGAPDVARNIGVVFMAGGVWGHHHVVVR